MRRKIPSTAALISFEAAARHESFTRAAEELSLTQGAICRQIASLEEFLSVELFRRSRRGVKLTEAGLSYSRRVATQQAAGRAPESRAAYPVRPRVELAEVRHLGGKEIEHRIVPLREACARLERRGARASRVKGVRPASSARSPR